MSDGIDNDRANDHGHDDYPVDGDLPHVDERLADWVDGRLSERDRERFEAELRVSPHLREQVEEYERTVASIRSALQAPTQATELADRVMATLAADAVRAPVARQAFVPLLWAVTSAAALLGVAVWVDSWGVPEKAAVTQAADVDRLAKQPGELGVASGDDRTEKQRTKEQVVLGAAEHGASVQAPFVVPTEIPARNEPDGRAATLSKDADRSADRRKNGDPESLALGSPRRTSDVEGTAVPDPGATTAERETSERGASSPLAGGGAGRARSETARLSSGEPQPARSDEGQSDTVPRMQVRPPSAAGAPDPSDTAKMGSRGGSGGKAESPTAARVETASGEESRRSVAPGEPVAGVPPVGEPSTGLSGPETPRPGGPATGGGRADAPQPAGQVRPGDGAPPPASIEAKRARTVPNTGDPSDGPEASVGALQQPLRDDKSKQEADEKLSSAPESSAVQLGAEELGDRRANGTGVVARLATAGEPGEVLPLLTVTGPAEPADAPVDAPEGASVTRAVEVPATGSPKPESSEPESPETEQPKVRRGGAPANSAGAAAEANMVSQLRGFFRRQMQVRPLEERLREDERPVAVVVIGSLRFSALAATDAGRQRQPYLASETAPRDWLVEGSKVDMDRLLLEWRRYADASERTWRTGEETVVQGSAATASRSPRPSPSVKPSAKKSAPDPEKREQAESPAERRRVVLRFLPRR